ncbi:MAG: aminotransferase class I/II-fold pyridoxal phosphate-dependent enzyme, partial [Pseudomonadota bacterium]
FDGEPHASVLSHPELAERAFVISSFGKTYHVTGWKIAYCAAPERFSALLRKIHQYLTFTTITPVQYALADFMQSCPEHYENLPDFYQAKRDLFCELMRETKFKFEPSAGTYFQLADYTELSELPDTEYVRHLTIDKGVAAIPLSVFYEEPPEQRLIRFCFAKDDDTLRTAVDILAGL